MRLYEGELVKPYHERTVSFDGVVFTESRLREALRWIDAQPKHGWRAGDIFRHKESGNIWRIVSLEGSDGCQIQCLWTSADGLPGVGGSTTYRWGLSHSEDVMIRLVEAS